MRLELVRNPDILTEVAALENRPFCVGFAAETEKLVENARSKLQKKRLDMIAANRVDDPDSGFEVDQNALSVYWQDGSQQLARQPKNLIARQLIDIIARAYRQAADQSETV